MRVWGGGLASEDGEDGGEFREAVDFWRAVNFLLLLQQRVHQLPTHQHTVKSIAPLSQLIHYVNCSVKSSALSSQLLSSVNCSVKSTAPLSQLLC